MDIELHDLGSGAFAGVFHVHCERDFAVAGHRSGVGTGVGQLECGVAQAVAEGKLGLGLLLVDPAVAHIDAFLVLLINYLLVGTPCSRIGVQLVCAYILKRCRPCERGLSRRIHIANEYRSQCVACLGTEEPALDDGGNAAAPRHGHGVARYVYEHDAPVGFRQCSHYLVLGVWQIHVLTVVSFAILIVALVQSADEYDVIGTLRLCDGVGNELLFGALVVKILTCRHAVVGSVCVAYIPTFVIDGYSFGSKACLDAVQRRHLTLHFQRRRAATNGHHLHGVLTNDEHTLCGLQVDGQKCGVVLEQDDTVFGYLPCGFVVCIGAEEAVRAVAVHRGAEVETQDTAHFLVEFLRAVLSLVDGFEVGLREEVVVVGVGCAHSEAVGPCSEFEVEAVLHRLIKVVTAAPVAHYHAVELPVVFQYLVQQPLVVAVVFVLIEVVGSHYSPCAAFGDGSLECRQIDFVQRTVADYDINLMAILLIVVQCVVLYACRHAARLQSLDVRHHHPRCEIRVFAHVFEVASAERCAVDVHAGTQNHVLSTIECLFAEAVSVGESH